MNNKELLQSYRSLWKNRELVKAEENADVILLQAMEKELRDENAHPRVRRDKQTKLIASIRRIKESSLPAEHKVVLIENYFQVFDEID